MSGRLIFRYVYDDGPKKVVQELGEVEINAGAPSYDVYSGSVKVTGHYTVSGLNARA